MKKDFYKMYTIICIIINIVRIICFIIIVRTKNKNVDLVF